MAKKKSKWISDDKAKEALKKPEHVKKKSGASLLYGAKEKE